MKAALFALAVGMLAACGAGGGIKYKLAPASPAPDVPPQPKETTCDFKMLQEGPPGSFDELGTLTPVDFAATQQDELKGAIHAQVCALGGEFVITKQNSAGTYTTALVLRRHMANAPAAGGSDGAAPAPTPAPAPQ